MILSTLLEDLDFECNCETSEYDVASWYTDHIIDEFPLMNYEDIDDNIEISMEYENVCNTSNTCIIYYYYFNTTQELEDIFRNKYPEYCI